MIKVTFKDPELIYGKLGDHMVMFIFTLKPLLFSDSGEYFVLKMSDGVAQAFLCNKIKSIEHINPTDL